MVAFRQHSEKQEIEIRWLKKVDRNLMMVGWNFDEKIRQAIQTAVLLVRTSCHDPSNLFGQSEKVLLRIRKHDICLIIECFRWQVYNETTLSIFGAYDEFRSCAAFCEGRIANNCISNQFLTSHQSIHR